MNRSDPRFDPTSLREAKALKSAQSQIDESARMIARQKVLLEELGPENPSSLELQRSLVRLEAVHDMSKAALDVLQAGGGEHDVRPSGKALPEMENAGPQTFPRNGRQQPSWFRPSKRPA